MLKKIEMFKRKGNFLKQQKTSKVQATQTVQRNETPVTIF